MAMWGLSQEIKRLQRALRKKGLPTFEREALERRLARAEESLTAHVRTFGQNNYQEERFPNG
jgi:hypothetical protein